MWDGGSTLSFITFTKAESLELKGLPVKLKITVVGGESKSIESYIYKLNLFDKDGKQTEIEAYGIQKISTQIEAVSLSRIACLLQIPETSLKRPLEGEIDVLIGQQYAGLHPVRISSNGHLVLMENEFGLVVAGICSLAKTDTEVSHEYTDIREAVVMHVDIQSSPLDFFEIEGLGVSCQPKCGGCRCGSCHPGGKSMSLQEEKEYELIEECLKFRTDTGRWEASYPWIKPPEELPDNRMVALATLRSAEKRLKRKKELGDLYNQQIEDMLLRGVARNVPEDELVKYTGPKFYIHHFEVLNPKSKSTPCRIVYNSSANYKGHSLNSYLAKGPTLLNHLLGVLLRFRQGKHAFIGDISKMYHAISIPLREQMTHLFLWRNLREDSHPKTYAMTAVNMGDRPSSAIAQIALRKTAEESMEIYPAAANTIIENAYMDDIPGSTNSSSETDKLTKEIEEILGAKGFKIKEWICSYLSNTKVDVQQIINPGSIREGVLGVMWAPLEDILQFSIAEVHDEPVITKRNMLSFTNKIYDPIGLLTPFTVRLKILVRKVWALEPKIGWDDEVPDDIQKKWKEIMEESAAISSIRFKRSLQPDNAVGDPTLLIFSDGSEDAYGAAAYARWEINDGNYCARLIAAKSRLAPLKRIDIVRLELCGAVLSKRLRFTITSELKLKWQKVVHLTDSEIVQAMIHKESYGFNTFAANRIGEIQEGTKKDEWCWIPGKPWVNIADITTRGARLCEIDEDSLWQNGPSFLMNREEDWPSKQTVRHDLPLPELKQKFIVGTVCASKVTMATTFNLERFSKWRLLVHTTARILRMFRRFKAEESSYGPQPTIKDISDAELLWIKEAQIDIDKEKTKRLKPTIEEGIIVVGGRTERWMQATWNRQKFVLLPKDHRISHLIMRYEHESGGHLGTAATISKIRSKYWIVGVTRAVKSLIRKCVVCQRLRKKMCSQEMSLLPIERIKPTPPFTHIMVDYFGPFQVKGEVQKRIRGKCYGVIFTCLVCRGIYVDVANDYSTDGFLQVLRRFASVRGWPSKIFSDPGAQLVGASKELKTVVMDLSWENVQAHGIENGVEWIFSPAEAPWYNGAVESLVKTVKKALNAAIGENVLSFSELLTCVFEASQLVNQRPIGKHPSNPDDGTYLCPNDLILGRATADVPQGPFKERISDKHRLDFIQSLVNRFWTRWTREVFPNLVIERKWHTAQRNLRIGDVVLVQLDASTLRGKWKMARVLEAQESEDGKVRHVKLIYASDTGIKQEIERPVQKLILLVPSETVAGECSACH